MPLVLFGICLCLASRAWPQSISKMAKYSFGIYLCHPIVLDQIEIATRNSQVSPIGLVSLKITVGIAVTTILVWCLGKTKVLAWTIGLGALPTLLNPKLTFGEHVK
ncbi:MAG: acyltransferase family protein [Planktomarina sp.]